MQQGNVSWFFRPEKPHHLSFLILIFWGFQSLAFGQNFSRVNPFIGTGGHGHTFPGATSPFGMVQLSPDTRLDGWDGCSGYHYSDSLIYGFSHTHLSGTGCSDYGDILLMPVMKEPRDNAVLFSNRFYASRFSHSTEKAHAGYYSVFLEDDQIQAEMTTSERVGFHQYSFSFPGNVKMVLDLMHRDELLNGQIRIVNDRTIEGFRRSKAWATDQWVFFRIEFSKKVMDFIPFSGKKGIEKTGMAMVFRMAKGEKLSAKVSLSQVSAEGANRNMQAEIPHWDFEKAKAENENRWERELSKIKISDPDQNKVTIFYSALYHAFIQPNLASDVDGQYRGRDGKVHTSKDHPYYTVFSLWDTFRSAHPLYNILQRERNLDFIRTFLLQYQQGGRLPVWELSSNETDCMIGYHSVSVIADAWAKGLRNFDVHLAREAMLASANRDVLGLSSIKRKGFIPIEDESESVSKTLEYAYDDWCISQLLEGKDKEIFLKRAQGWKHLFDPTTHLMRPRSNGGWLSPFEPREVNNHFSEANAWQYGFFVPHDVGGLMALHGGKQAFVQKLDALFATSSQTTGRTQADITGLIGQYAHGNEPSHHIPWLYTLAGAPAETQKRVRQILDDLYKNAPDGLSGNEDCGQMSAWLVFSAMGLYPLCPGSDQYVMGCPWLEEVEVAAEGGKWISISAKGSGKNRYVADMVKDGKPYPGLIISHEDWVKSGKWKITTSASPEGRLQKFTGVEVGSWGNIQPAPRIMADKQVFRDSLVISMENTGAGPQILYRLEPNGMQMIYSQPFVIHSSQSISAWYMVNGTDKGPEAVGNFFKIPHTWEVQIKHPYNPQYNAGGPDGLIDGLRGDGDWRKGRWQGYQMDDFEVVVDLKNVKPVKKVAAGFLQDTRSWIVLPKEVEVFVSMDGKQFSSMGKINHTIPVEKEESFVHELAMELKAGTQARYVKLIARRFGALPEWHQGHGEPSFIFVDEVMVE